MLGPQVDNVLVSLSRVVRSWPDLHASEANHGETSYNRRRFLAHILRLVSCLGTYTQYLGDLQFYNSF